MPLTIATWNCSLGLANKTDFVKCYLEEYKIDVLFLQETEIKPTTPLKHLEIPKYNLELSQTYGQLNSRTCCYIRSKIKYERLKDQESNKVELISIKAILSYVCCICVRSDPKVELILIKTNSYMLCGFYRLFLLPNHNNELEYISETVSLLENIKNENVILLGDFNMDFRKVNNQDYKNARLYNLLETVLIEKTLVQIINEPTWQRKCKTSLNESILDHIYVSNLCSVIDQFNEQQIIGDHNLVGVVLQFEHKNFPHCFPKTVQDWSKYSKELLINKLSTLNLGELETLDVESHISALNQMLGTILDDIIPTINIKRKEVPGFISISYIRQNRKRRNYYKKFKKTGNLNHLKKAKTLEKDIMKQFEILKKNKIRSKIKPGDPKSLWQAVNISMNNVSETIPEKIYWNNEVAEDDQKKADIFCKFFNDKVCNIIINNPYNRAVYNGRKLVNDVTINPFTFNEVYNILKNLPLKNCSGIDRIPLRFLNDGKEILAPTIFSLMTKIWTFETIPEIWKITKTQPLFKTGNKNQISNYRPISNLCSLSKIFEKLILLKIDQVAKLNNIDLTNKNQHGFKAKHSTKTAMLDLQYKIATALDNNEYAATVSLDLSAAFDVVNHELLIKRLQILGLPEKIINLLRHWLQNRFMYVNVNGSCSIFTKILAGTLQGSCLGPILFALFISPMYDISDCITYADDNYTVETGRDIDVTIGKVKMKTEILMSWLRDSGMQVNSKKTEFCIFHRSDVPLKKLTLLNEEILSKKEIKVLGVLFDSKLNWHSHINSTILKCKKTLQAIRLVLKNFTIEEKLNIVTSLFYSRLYYGAEVWLIPSLNRTLKNKLLNISTQALRIVAEDTYRTFNAQELHIMLNRFTPTQMSNYVSLLNLYRCINYKIPELLWVELQFKYLPLTRSNKFLLPPTNKLKIGLNVLSNRLSYASTLISNDDLNREYSSFKVESKKIAINT